MVFLGGGENLSAQTSGGQNLSAWKLGGTKFEYMEVMGGTKFQCTKNRPFLC